MKRILLLILIVPAASGLMAAILFAAAGRWDLPFIWAIVAVCALFGLGAGIGIDPGLMRERIKPEPGGHDRRAVVAMKLFTWAGFIFGAADVGRLHWSDSVPRAVQIIGLIGFAAGFAIVLWAMLTNRFFSPIVRIQTERGHHLITQGPYRFVRHPGYAGFILACLSTGLAFGSWGAMVPTTIVAAIVLRRTLLEDTFVRAELDGYGDYTQRVRWRLVPGVW